MFSTSGGKGRLSHARLRELARSTVSSRRGERGEESGEGGARGGKRRRRRDESEGEKTSPKTKGPGSRRPAKRFSSVGGGGPGRRCRATRLFLALFSRSGPGPARRAFFLFTSEGAPPPSLSLAQGRTRSSRAEARAARSLSLSLERSRSILPLLSGRGWTGRRGKKEEANRASLPGSSPVTRCPLSYSSDPPLGSLDARHRDVDDGEEKRAGMRALGGRAGASACLPLSLSLPLCSQALGLDSLGSFCQVSPWGTFLSRAIFTALRALSPNPART